MPTVKTLIIITALVLVAVAVAIVAKRPAAAPPVTTSPTGSGVISYLALGDSYTIGESVAEAERWPNQLVARLATDGTKLQLVGNPSVTGYTTQDLIDRELPLVTELKPDFVTILIGVNDYVQGVESSIFKQRLEYIVDTVQKQIADPNNVLLVTIPDYGKTPSGARFGAPAETEAGIRTFNAIIAQTAASRKLPLADVFPASLLAAQDPALVASDGLHPSGKQYTAWTDVIYDSVKASTLFK